MKKRTLLFAAGAGIAALLAVTRVSGQDASPAAAPAGMMLWETATAAPVEATPEMLELGKRVYEQRCALCHGKNGDGRGAAALFLATPPRDFTQATYKFHTNTRDNMPTDLDLFRSVTAGFPTYGMPAFTYLSERERWASVHYVKQLTRKGYDRFLAGRGIDGEERDELVAEAMQVGPLVEFPEEPEGDRAAILERGKELFLESCAKCHGETGLGDGPSLDQGDMVDIWGHPSLPVPMGAGNAYRKTGWRIEDTVRVTYLGIPGTPMPAMKFDFATEEGRRDLWALARFSETLERSGK